MCRHPDSPFAMPGKLLDFSPFRHSGEGRNPVVYTRHSRTAGMTITGTKTERAIRQNLPSLHHPGLPSWIPACAGMTTGAGMGLSPSRSLFAMPGKLPDFSRLTSFRRRPESSGLHKPFPHSGNDNHRNDDRMCYPAKPTIHSLPWPLFLDSSLRWNDDRGGNGFVAIPTAPLLFLANYLTSTSSVIAAQAGIQWFRQAIPAQRE